MFASLVFQVGLLDVSMHSDYMGTQSTDVYAFLMLRCIIGTSDGAAIRTFLSCPLLEFYVKGGSMQKIGTGFLRRFMNCIWYTLCMVYCPFGVHFLLISSSEFYTRFTVLTPSQRVMNSWSSSINWIGDTCEIHLFCIMALLTVIFFLFVFLNRDGAMYFGACPSIQFECQKLALSPLPTVTFVKALKRSLPILSQGTSNPVQGLPFDP